MRWLSCSARCGKSVGEPQISLISGGSVIARKSDERDERDRVDEQDRERAADAARAKRSTSGSSR